MSGRYANQWVIGILLTYLMAFLPVWPYSQTWDYAFSGRIAVVLVVFVVLKITKYI